MYITKTLAMPRLDASDCLKIVSVSDECKTPLGEVLRGLLRAADFDISDDELLAHLCVREGLFSYKEWQELINGLVCHIYSIDYEVDSTKGRLTLAETVYQMGGCTGRVPSGGYKMISALTGRDLVFRDAEQFTTHFGKPPREYILSLWEELDALLTQCLIEGEYTNELHFAKYPKANRQIRPKF